MKLRFGSGGCVASGIEARIAGSDAGEAVAASFYLNRKKAGDDGSAPFERKLAAKALSRSNKNRVEAIVTTRDGRLTTVQRAAPPHC